MKKILLAAALLGAAGAAQAGDISVTNDYGTTGLFEALGASNIPVTSTYSHGLGPGAVTGADDLIGAPLSFNDVGGGWFGEIKPSWLQNQIADQQLGGGIAWGFGELPTIFVLAILVYQWAYRDERLAKRVTDKEIDDNNDYLKSLNK